MKLAVDVMGFENSISEAINACRDFINKHNDVEIILVGNQDQIKTHLRNEDQFQVVHANDVIEQNDEILSLRIKKDSSMKKAIELVANQQVDGVLSAGNSSVYVFLCYQQLGLIECIQKIGFMPFIPTFDKKGFNLLDVGASIDVEGIDLYMFAIMAKTYCQLCCNIKNPSIGLLNIGTEKHKGYAYLHNANDLLKANPNLNYLGFVESKNLLAGVGDIIITDGYAGNITLKALEGTAKVIFKDMLNYFKKPLHWLAFPFVAPYMLKTKKKFDYKNNAGAFVLGVNGIAVKTHGSADYKQFYSSLRMLRDSISFNILDEIKKEVKYEYERMKHSTN